jgi:hypothetical protein
MPFPLADLGEMLQSLLPIIIVVLYGIAHLVGNFQQEKKKAPPPRPRPMLPPQEARGEAGRLAPGGNPPAGNQPTLEETLRREVEEFLRRAQGEPQQKPKREPQRQPRPQQRPSAPTARRPAQPPIRSPEEDPQRTRRLVESQRPEPAAPLTPLKEPRPSIAPTPLSTSVAGHAQSIGLHTQTLGVDIALADERMEDHLRERFAHRVGALSPTTKVQRQATGNPAAAELRALLSRPGGARQLIIASEILRRPEERWEDTVQATDLRRQASGREN